MEDFEITGETVLVSPTKVIVYEQRINTEGDFLDLVEHGVWRFLFLKEKDEVQKTRFSWDEFIMDYRMHQNSLQRHEEDNVHVHIPAWFLQKYKDLRLKYQLVFTS